MKKKILLITVMILISTSGVATAQQIGDSIYLQDSSSNQIYNQGDTIELDLGITTDNLTYYETYIDYNREYVEFQDVEGTSNLFTGHSSNKDGTFQVSAESSKPISKDKVASLRFKVKDDIPEEKTVSFGLSSSEVAINGDLFEDLSERGTKIYVENNKDSGISNLGIEVDGSATVERYSSTTITAYPYRLDVDGDEEYDEDDVEFKLVVDKNADQDYTDHKPVSEKEISLNSNTDNINFEYNNVSLSAGKYGYKVFAEKSDEYVDSQVGTLIVNQKEDSIEDKIDIIGIEIPSEKQLQKSNSSNELTVYPNYYGSPIDNVEFKAELDTDGDGEYNDHTLASKKVNLDETQSAVSFKQFNTDIEEGTYDYKVFAEKSDEYVDSQTGSLKIDQKEDSIEDKIDIIGIEIPSEKQLQKSNSSNELTVYPNYYGSPIDNVEFKAELDTDEDGDYDHTLASKKVNLDETQSAVSFKQFNTDIEEGTYDYKVFAEKSGFRSSSYTSSEITIRDDKSISELELSLPESEIRVTKGDDEFIPVYPSYQNTKLLEDVKLLLLIDKNSNNEFDEDPVESEVIGISPTTFKINMNYYNVNLDEGTYDYTVYATKSGEVIKSENVGSLTVQTDSNKQNNSTDGSENSTTENQDYNVSLSYDEKSVTNGKTFDVGFKIIGQNVTGYEAKVDYNRNYLNIADISGSNFADPEHIDFNKYVSISAEKSSGSNNPKVMSLDFKTSLLPESRNEEIEFNDIRIYSNGEMVDKIDSKEIQIEIDSDTQDENETEFRNDTQDENETEFRNDTQDENETEFRNNTQDENETEFRNNTQDENETEFRNNTQDENNSSVKPEIPRENQTGDGKGTIPNNTTNESGEPQINRSIVERVIELFVEQNNEDVQIESDNNSESTQSANNSSQLNETDSKDANVTNEKEQNNTNNENSNSLTDIIVELFS